MYEYFGVGPQLLEDVDDMFPKFLCWLPKYRLSTPPKRSFQTWRMVVDNLAANDVRFLLLLLLLLFVFGDFVFLCCVVWLLFILGSL